MSKSNVADFQKAANARRRKESLNVEDICGDGIGHYKANVKSDMMMFIHDHIRGMDQDDAVNALGIDAKQVDLLKNLRVSQFSIDNLFDMAYKLGYTFDMSPYPFRDDHPSPTKC